MSPDFAGGGMPPVLFAVGALLTTETKKRERGTFTTAKRQ